MKSAMMKDSTRWALRGRQRRDKRGDQGEDEAWGREVGVRQKIGGVGGGGLMRRATVAATQVWGAGKMRIGQLGVGGAGVRLRDSGSGPQGLGLCFSALPPVPFQQTYLI